jgi:NitT/TauT family transport system ATP-binding protein
MRQRVAIARALINQPEVLLMDEPFGALDSQTRATMQQLLLSIWEDLHPTILFVTHDVDEALFLGNQVYVMTARPGRIRERLRVDIGRPRRLDVTTSDVFISLKRSILGAIREEVELAD